jgi:hypothetical protein
MFDLRYKGRRIEPSKEAVMELLHEGKDLYFVLEVLEDGYGCSASRRSPCIEEKCFRIGNKEYRAVAVKTEVFHPDNEIEPVWRIIHFSSNTFQKNRSRK